METSHYVLNKQIVLNLNFDFFKNYSQILVFKLRILKWRTERGYFTVYKSLDFFNKINFVSGEKKYFNPIQDGEGRANPPPLYQFFPLTSTNVEISPRNILTFSFNPFATLV